MWKSLNMINTVSPIVGSLSSFPSCCSEPSSVFLRLFSSGRSGKDRTTSGLFSKDRLPASGIMDHLAMPGSVSDCCGSSVSKKGSAFFGVPRLFVGFAPKGLPDGESVWSPTSPLDVKTFPGSGNPYRSPRSHLSALCDQSKVGLSIVDSLDDDPLVALKVLRSLDSKIILSGLSEINSPIIPNSIPSVSTAAKSLPRNFAIFPRSNPKSPLEKSHSAASNEIDPGRFGSIRSSSFDSCKQLSSINRSSQPARLKSVDSGAVSITTSPLSINGVAEPLTASEIELSEDYTCIISHGPNPKTTHIYGDRVLECHPSNLTYLCKSSAGEDDLKLSDISNKCCYCDKNLSEGDDTFFSRIEKPLQGNTIAESLEREPDGCRDDNCESLFESTIFDV